MDYDDDPMTYFRDALSNMVTRKKSERRLARFFDFIELSGTIQAQAIEFVKHSEKDPKWTVAMIMKYMRYQKERAEKGEISTATIPNYYKSIKTFCEMNDLILNWKKITRSLPKAKTKATDRIPTKDEIKKLLTYPDRRIKPAILTMLSSGIRVGAWDYLRWGDVQPIMIDDKVSLAKLVVYRGEPEEYFTFISPEAFEELKSYMEFRARHGETISEKSWLMRDVFDPYGFKPANLLKRLKGTGVKRLIERALWTQGIRKKLEKGKKRHEFQTDHGFRKFFNTMAERNMKSLHVEILMGHSIGLGDNYYRPSEKELFEEYVKTIQDLSIYGSTHHEDRIKYLEKEFMRIQSDVAEIMSNLGKDDSKKVFANYPNLIKRISFDTESDGMIIKDIDGTEYLQ